LALSVYAKYGISIFIPEFTLLTQNSTRWIWTIHRISCD